MTGSKPWRYWVAFSAGVAVAGLAVADTYAQDIPLPHLLPTVIVSSLCACCGVSFVLIAWARNSLVQRSKIRVP